MGCIQSKPKGKDLPQGGDDVTQSNRPAYIRYDDDPVAQQKLQGSKETSGTEHQETGPEVKHVASDDHVSGKATAAKGTGTKDVSSDTAVKSSQAKNETPTNNPEGVELREKSANVKRSDDGSRSLEAGREIENDVKTGERAINRGTVTIATKFDNPDGLVRPDITSEDPPEDRMPAVDLGDISLGQGVEEIEMTGGQTIRLDGTEREDTRTKISQQSSVSRSSPETRQVAAPSIPSSSADENGVPTSEGAGKDIKVGGQEVDVANVMTTVHAPDSPNIRYQNRESLELELPAGVPRPAPPKSRKQDLIKPNQFTVVDKIVDQAPDDGFQSVPKLGQYLSGKLKKHEAEGLGEEEEEEDSGMFKNLPPPVPPRTRRRDLFTDVSVFKHVDENARNTPENVRTSVSKLAEHLCSVAKTDLEKVRAFYYWICNNIRYLYDKDNTIPNRMKFDAATTLRQGQGSFVSVFVALCKEANIPALTILGCSKGLRHQPDRSFHVAERNHCWNAVFLEGEWRFIDCTWGSGNMDVNRKFQPKFDEFWFLTDPEVFVYDHFPTHPIWQLLENPVDIDEFNLKPSMTETSQEVGFQLLSHREPIVYVRDEVTIQFSTEEIPLSNMTADFRSSSGEEINKHRCIRRLDGKVFEVRVVPPVEGEYSLIIYGKSKDYIHAKFRKLMEYSLRCEHAYRDPLTFPNHLKAWGPEPNYEKFGFADDIQSMSVFSSETNELTIPLKQTKNTVVSVELKATDEEETVLNEYLLVTAGQKLQKDIHIRFPHPGYFKLEVYAEGDLDKYEYVAAFLINCTCQVDSKPEIFPKYNVDAVCKHQCELLEPLKRNLPANTTVTFRMKSVGLKNAMLGAPLEADYGSRLKRLAELSKKKDVFEGTIQTPKKGETVMLSGSAAPPNVFWARTYEFVIV